MEDMKKLVEKYKRELMEYSRQAPKPEKLSFPEMLPEEPPAQGVQEIPEHRDTQPQSSEPPKPRIIGYSDDQRALNDLEKYFSDIINTAPPSDGNPEASETSDRSASFRSRNCRSPTARKECRPTISTRCRRSSRITLRR